MKNLQSENYNTLMREIIYFFDYTKKGKMENILCVNELKELITKMAIILNI